MSNHIDSAMRSAGLGPRVSLGPVIIILASLSVIGGVFWVNYSGTNHDSAKEAAAEYAAELKIDVRAISCVGMDSDGDGYVSCTIMPKAEGSDPIQVECTGVSLNSGCRFPKANLRR